jgi:hypothetical protein
LQFYFYKKSDFCFFLRIILQEYAAEDRIIKCIEADGQIQNKKITQIFMTMEKSKIEQKSNGQGSTPFSQTYFHGTKANLMIGGLIEAGFNSNFGQRKNARYIFLSATLDAAIWGAELAFGEDSERIYLVEPTGVIEDDPDLTDKKFPGNPTKSYRSIYPFKIVGEVKGWQGHPAEQVKAMKDGLARLKEQGIESLNN